MFTGGMRGFKKTEDEPSEDVVEAALRIQKGGDGVYITQGGLEQVAEFRAINEVLQNGTADMEATKKLVEAIMINPGTELVTVNPMAIRSSLPYFRKLIGTALASPKFRDMLAWQQYWDERTGQR